MVAISASCRAEQIPERACLQTESTATGAEAGYSGPADIGGEWAHTSHPSVSTPMAPPRDREAEARKEAGVGIGLADDLRHVRTALVKAHLAGDFEAAFDLMLFQMARSVFTFGYMPHALDIAVRETTDRPTMRMNDADFETWSPGEAMLADRSGLSLDWMQIGDGGESFAALRALARRGCTVLSRPRSPDGETQPGWRVELEPAHFLGEADAEIRTDTDAPFPHGALISFLAMESAAAIRNAAENAARHYPLPVPFDDGTADAPRAEELPRRAFLDRAVHAEQWRGLAFGVFRDRRRGNNDPDLNFFGLTLPVGLPTIETVHGPTWTVRADVNDCPDLELVLPARKEPVVNDFLTVPHFRRIMTTTLPATEPSRPRAGP